MTLRHARSKSITPRRTSPSCLHCIEPVRSLLGPAFSSCNLTTPLFLRNIDSGTGNTRPRLLVSSPRRLLASSPLLLLLLIQPSRLLSSVVCIFRFNLLWVHRVRGHPPPSPTLGPGALGGVPAFGRVLVSAIFEFEPSNTGGGRQGPQAFLFCARRSFAKERTTRYDAIKPDRPTDRPFHRFDHHFAI